MKKQYYWLFIILFVQTTLSLAQTCKLTVTNPSSFQRSEVLQLPTNVVTEIQKKLRNTSPEQWVVRDAAGLEVLSQYTFDHQFLISIELIGKGSHTFSISIGTPTTYESSVFAKMYSERLDDIAWENDRIAFRTYGPALQKTGEKAYGYDVWVKNIPDLVVDARYRLQYNKKYLDAIARTRKTDKQKAQRMEQALSYHVNHGNGMDCYKVGPTLGCGTPALLSPANELIYPWCYQTYQILDNGPLRTTIQLDYETKNLSDLGAITETRIISLDKFSQLNFQTVRYSGIKSNTTAVAGIVIHAADTTSLLLNTKSGFMSYADPTDNAKNNNGKIFIGCLFPNKIKGMEIRRFSTTENVQSQGSDFGHLLTKATVNAASPTFSYYFGAAWSKYNISSWEKWNLYLQQFSERLKHPLKLKLQ